MKKHDEWNEFLESLRLHAIDMHRETHEGELLREKQAQLDELLMTNLLDEDRGFVEEILFDTGVIADRKSEVVYHQGWKDCVWLLKHLGVFS